MNGDPTITICGNITAEPELRYTQSGTAVATVTIAHTPRVRREGEWVDGTPLFIRASIWREQAEHVAQSLTKGARVVATGSLKQDEWTDQTSGEKRTAIAMTADEIGASLRYADASIRKASRSNGAPTPVDPVTGEAATATTPEG